MNRYILLFLGAAGPLTAQNGDKHKPALRPPAEGVVARDSITLQANGRYDAGPLHRWFMGHTWRDFWETPIRVPTLDLDRFAGGITATEEGGGAQTRSLRFKSPDGRVWTFRPLAKEKLTRLEDYEGTIIEDLFRDGLSGAFPGAPVVPPPILSAVGIPHPVPHLVVLPSHPRLGEFRRDFAGKLGTIEEHLSDGDDVPLIAGAVELIDAEDLLEKLNEEPRRHLNGRAMLTARLVDMLLGDTDRHRDQWKWARLSQRDSLFVPVPRDRDQALSTHDGFVLGIGRKLKPYLVTFDSTIPPRGRMVGNMARDLDRRLLAEQDRNAWMDAARFIQRVVTDSVIHAAVTRLPAGYHAALPSVEHRLRARRDVLHEGAASYYAVLSRIVDVHATDSADEARIARASDGSVLVELGAPGRAWYSRRFVPGETEEVRLYLHAGDDRATVTGPNDRRLVVRVIGGGGNNNLVDRSEPDDMRATRLYEAGESPEERFEPDSAFNRLPWLRVNHSLVPPPARDWGQSLRPTGRFGSGRGLGVVPRLGIKQTNYGFRYYPYKSTMSLQGEYSTRTRGFRVLAAADRRIEMSNWHVGGALEMSQFDVVQYFGLGNDVNATRDPFYDVDLRTWSARPVVGYAFSPEGDVTVGPVLKYASTRDRPGFLQEERPYGTGDFTQLGLEMQLKHDTRDNSVYPRHGAYIEAAASTWPALGSVEQPFHRLSARALTYLPLPRQSVLALRAGGERVFGPFPYYESAFLGGSRTLRSVRYHRLAGDATAFGAAELRVPVASFPWILPWKTGLLGYTEAGRVFVDGRSPGGWHQISGAGFWIGVQSHATSLNVLFTNGRERRILVGTGMNF